MGASGSLQQHGNNRQTVRGRQASVILLSVHQTHEGATVSANQTSLSAVASLSQRFQRLRDILGMNHRESIYVLAAKISWNAFNGIEMIWIIRTV